MLATKRPVQDVLLAAARIVKHETIVTERLHSLDEAGVQKIISALDKLGIMVAVDFDHGLATITVPIMNGIPPFEA